MKLLQWILVLLCPFLYSQTCIHDRGNGQLNQPACVLLEADLVPLQESEVEKCKADLAKSSFDVMLELRLGVSLIHLAGNQRWHYLNEAVEYLRAAVKRFPGDPHVAMFLGRAIGAQALDTNPSTLTRLKWAREGFKWMDEAVRLQPNCFYLRLMRGDAQLLAHPILRRGDKLEEDMRLVLRHSNSPDFKGLPKLEQARFCLFLGNYFAKRSERVRAQSFWQQAAKLGEASPTGREALSRLNNKWNELGYDGG